MAATAPDIGDAFRKLQAGDAAGALECARRLVAENPANARAHLAVGIASRMAGRYADAAAALARAQALDPGDHAAAYELGIVCQLEGRHDDALGHFERCARLRPEFFAAHFSAGLIHADRGEWARAAACFRAVIALQPEQPDALLHLAVALERDHSHREAEAAYVHALAANPHHPPTVRAFGQYSASRGNFKRAASLFTEAGRLEPRDDALPLYLAQCELLLGRWQPAWAAYARRGSRREFERVRGAVLSIPEPAELAGRDVTLVGEQGLGDTLFFLRWAPLANVAGATLRFAGDSRLHPLLARTGLFVSLEGSAAARSSAHPILVGDLPTVFAAKDPLQVPSLAISSLPERLDAWKATLQALGPKPWIGVQWRSGTRPDVVRHALSKQAPLEPLFASLAPLGGTLLALQRDLVPGELAAARAAAGREVHDLSRANADLDDLLALVALLDRHVAVSSTTLHLAAAAGTTADVLVPFPPEWRWRAEGQSPWFAGFRVHRQGPDLDWPGALASATLGPGG